MVSSQNMVSFASFSAQKQDFLRSHTTDVLSHHDTSHGFFHLAKPSCGLSTSAFCLLSKMAASFSHQSSFKEVYQDRCAKRNDAETAIKQITCSCPRDRQIKETFNRVIASDKTLEDIAQKDFKRISWITYPLIAWLAAGIVKNLACETDIASILPERLPPLPQALKSICSVADDFRNFLFVPSIVSLIRYTFSRQSHVNTLSIKQKLEKEVTDLSPKLEEPKCYESKLVTTFFKVISIIKDFFKKIEQALKSVNPSLSRAQTAPNRVQQPVKTDLENS